MRRTSGYLSLKDLELWVQNDEPLYRAWKRSRLPLRRFISENRDAIRAVVGRQLGHQPAGDWDRENIAPGDHRYYRPPGVPPGAADR